jgi:hypothetical protein
MILAVYFNNVYIHLFPGLYNYRNIFKNSVTQTFAQVEEWKMVTLKNEYLGRSSCKLEGNMQLDHRQKDMRMCTAFNCFRTGICSEVLQTQREPLVSWKRRKVVNLVGDFLPSKECCLVNYLLICITQQTSKYGHKISDTHKGMLCQNAKKVLQ